jgi:flagellar hook protein FlgE
MDNNGEVNYQRNGQFQLDRMGFIVTPSGAKLTGYTANASGVLSTGAPAPLSINTADLAPQVTTGVNAVINLNSSSVSPTVTPFDMNDPLSFNNSMSVSVYDSLGNQHTLQNFFVKTAANTWEVHASLNGDPSVSVGTLTFDASGSLTSGSPITIPPQTLTTGANTLGFPMDFTGTTQFGSPFSVNTLNQDGFTSGRLAGFNIGPDGTIQGRYTNGQSKVLGQVVLANFANPNGLQPLGNNMWAETATSGAALVGTPDSGSLGVLQSSAVEDSNVDLTAELVNMITAQRVYQANAQTIKAQDAVLQTLVNLR